MAATLWSYWPSLQHSPKHDQLSYLAETARFHSPAEIISGTISLNRSRIFMGRDETFFRPLLNVWLGLQRVAFGYDFPRWQAAGLALHLGVGLAMYYLLNFLRPGLPAAMLTAFFLLMLSNIPMVVWHHISAYLIFLILLLLALRHYAAFLKNPDNDRAVWLCGSFMLPTVFIFEAGLFFCLCLAAGIFLIRRDVRLSAWLLFPLALYASLSLMDLVLRQTVVNSEFSRVMNSGISLHTLKNSLLALKWFVTAGLFAHAKDVLELQRVVLAPWTLNPVWPFIGLDPALIRGLCAGLLLVVMLAAGRSSLTRDKFFAATAGVMIVTLVLFISVGRLNTRGIITGLFFNAYYIYFFWVLLIPAVYAWIDWEKILRRPEGRLIRLACYALLAGMMFINILSIRNITAYIARLDAPRVKAIAAMERFAAEHAAEPDFTFFMPHNCPGNYAGNWLRQNTDPKSRRYTLSEALFPYQYSSYKTAKYLLLCP